MPTYQEQIAALVDEGIKAGRVQSAMRQKYIDDIMRDPALAELIAGGVMRNADYTNKSKEREEAARRAQAEIETQRQAVARERAELQTWQRDAKAEIDRLRAFEGETPRLQAAVARYQQVLKDYNLTEADPLAGQPPAPAPSYTPPAQPADPSRTAATQPTWVTQADAVNALNSVLDVNGELQVIMAEHQFLFGAPLRDNLIQEARQAGQLGNIRGLWESKYNVAAKRTELDDKTRTEREDAIRREERERVLAEVANDPTRHINPNGSIWERAPSPIDHYMNSRATQHSPVAPENRNGDTPAGSTTPAPIRVPEQVPHIQSVRESVGAADAYFRKNFNPDGSPISRGPDRTS